MSLSPSAGQQTLILVILHNRQLGSETQRSLGIDFLEGK